MARIKAHSFFLETTGKSGVGETGYLTLHLGGCPLSWSTKVVPYRLRTCPAHVALIQTVECHRAESGARSHISLPWLPSLGGCIPTALPVPHEPLHLKLLEISSELPRASISWRFDRITFLLLFTCLKACYSPPPCPSLYYRRLVL